MIDVQVNGQQVTYTSCDGNPNSYLSLFPNVNNLTPLSYYGGLKVYTQMMNAMEKSAVYLPVEYFMFLETRWGGCGTYAQAGAGQSNTGVIGVAVGFR